MATLTEPIRATIWEDGGATPLARVTGADGAAITQASLTSISYKVFDLNSTTPSTAVATGTVTIATSVFDTLQTDAIWSEDTSGYNFKHTIASTVFTTGGHAYRVEYLFTPASGQPFWVVFELHTHEVMTS